MTKKRYFLFFNLILLYSCSGPGTYQALYSVISDELPGKAYEPIEKSFYDNEEYSFVILKYGNKSPIKLVLVNSNDGVQHWISSDNISIYTNQYGRIIRTNGFENDISINGLYNQELKEIREARYFYDLYNPEFYKAAAEDIFISSRPDFFEIFQDHLIKAYEVIYITNVPSIKWSFKNSYIRNDDGLLYSSQEIHPFLDRINLYFFFK